MPSHTEGRPEYYLVDENLESILKDTCNSMSFASKNMYLSVITYQNPPPLHLTPALNVESTDIVLSLRVMRTHPPLANKSKVLPAGM